MSQTSIWGVFLLLCLCSPNLSTKCKWMQPQQERLSKVVLLSFKEMGRGEVFPLQCMNRTVFPPNIDHIYNTTEIAPSSSQTWSLWTILNEGLQQWGPGSISILGIREDVHSMHIQNPKEHLQVESAVVTLLEVTHQINRFYRKLHDFLGSNSKALETFQTHLHHQMEDLRDCIVINEMPSSLQWEMQKAITEYFSKLLEISSEKDNNVCARNIIRIEVQKQLQFTAQLTTRIRRQTLTGASVQ